MMSPGGYPSKTSKMGKKPPKDHRNTPIYWGLGSGGRGYPIWPKWVQINPGRSGPIFNDFDPQNHQLWVKTCTTVFFRKTD